MHSIQPCKRAGLLEVYSWRKDASQAYKISSRFGHILLLSANIPHQGHSIRWAWAPNWGSGRRQGTTGNQHSRTSCGRQDRIMSLQCPSDKLRAGEWDRMNRICATFIWTYWAKDGGLIPQDAAAPDLGGGKLCSLCVSWWAAGKAWTWGETNLYADILIHHSKTPNHLSIFHQPCQCSPIVQAQTSCLHPYNFRYKNHNQQWAGTRYFYSFEIELRMVLCPRSPEKVVKSWVDLIGPTWNFPPDRALRLFRVFCSD